MAQKLTEKLDYSFSYKDYLVIDKYITSFIEERKNSYRHCFIEFNPKVEANFEKSCKEYVEYFVANNGDDSHPALHRINHFINRQYEIFTLPEIQPLIDRLKFLLGIPYEEIDDFEEFITDYEVDTFTEIEEIWLELGVLLKNSPHIVLKDLRLIQKGALQIYFEPNSDDFIVQTIVKFAEKMVKSFPYQMSRLDSFFIVSKEYINFSCGTDDDSVMAFYLNDHIYFPSCIKPEDKDFFIFSIWHEAGHFMFELMTEESQEYWYHQYSLWEEKKTKLSRIKDEHNEVEECFADSFSYLMGSIKTEVSNFIQPPSDIVLSTVKVLINEEFVNNQPREVGEF